LQDEQSRNNENNEIGLVLTAIKQFLGLFLSYCDENSRYTVIQSLMHKIVILKAEISKNLVQEIMLVY
jgi:hypothetical protein